MASTPDQRLANASISSSGSHTGNQDSHPHSAHRCHCQTVGEVLWIPPLHPNHVMVPTIHHKLPRQARRQDQGTAPPHGRGTRNQRMAVPARTKGTFSGNFQSPSQGGTNTKGTRLPEIQDLSEEVRTTAIVHQAQGYREPSPTQNSHSTLNEVKTNQKLAVESTP